MSFSQRTDRQGLNQQIAHIAAVISGSGTSTGDRAALRRIVAGQPLPLPFYRFAQLHLPAGWEHREDDWVAIVSAMAIMVPQVHRPDKPLGRALAQAGYAEGRLERLLSSVGNTRRTLLVRASRFMAAKGEPFNWTEAARLLLLPEGDHEGRRDLHRKIATDYYYEKE